MPDVFTRGTAVFEYWLAHPEGMTVRPLNARVERAVGPAPFGPASAIVVRAPSGRTRRIPAERLVAVDPAKAELFLDGADGNDPVHDHVARAMRLTATGAAWTAPRAVATAVWFGECLALGARVVAVTSFRLGRATTLWLAPRVAAGCRRGAGYVRSTVVASRGITPKR